MFKHEKKISLQRVEELANELIRELEVEITRTVAKRQETDDERKIDNLYSYQHALEHSRMNINTLVYRIYFAHNYE